MTAPPAEVVLAVDVGSSRTRVALLDPAGAVVSQASAPTPVETPGAGRSELSVERLWKALSAAVRELGPGLAGVRAIGVSGLMSTAFLDADGRAVGPAMLWDDDRAAAYVATAGEDLARLTERTARRPPTGEMWGPRLAWLAEHEPERHAAVRRLGGVKDAVVALMTGEVTTDPTSASYSGLFDVGTGAWSPAAAAGWGVDPDLLPVLAAAATPAGGLRDAAAAELRLTPGLPVCVGAPDGSVGALAAGGVAAGRTVDIAGTSDVLNHLVDRPPAAAGGATVLNAFVVPGLWGLGGPTGMTGGAVAWTARLLGYRSVAEALAALGPEIDRIGPGAGGVSFRPHLSGSRFPEWASGAAGSISGLRAEHGPAHLLAGALEGAAFTVAAGVEAIRSTGETVTELRVGGGPAADRRSLRLRATAVGVPVRAARDPEMSTVGAAALAAVGGGLFADLGEAVAALGPKVETIEPDAAAAAPLGAAFERWRALGQGGG
jgi:sugar (pentulose or hexulose) kinase